MTRHIIHKHMPFPEEKRKGYYYIFTLLDLNVQAAKLDLSGFNYYNLFLLNSYKSVKVLLFVRVMLFYDSIKQKGTSAP